MKNIINRLAALLAALILQACALIDDDPSHHNVLAGVQYKGGDSIPFSDLIYHSTVNVSDSAVFQLKWVDRKSFVQPGQWWYIHCTNPRTGSILFSYTLNFWGSTGRFDSKPDVWPSTAQIDSLVISIRCGDCDEDNIAYSNDHVPVRGLKVFDDRPLLTTTFVGDSSKIKTGDTIQIELKNGSAKDSILVASDYLGMRLIGDYVVTLKPGQTHVMKWLVLALQNESVWLDLGWGDYGQSRRFVFPIH